MDLAIVRTKSGMARVCGSMNPRPPCAMVMYAMSRAGLGNVGVLVSFARKEKAMRWMLLASGPSHFDQSAGISSGGA